MKCSNGKYKYGEHGKCVFDTLAACKRAAAAIHIQDKSLDTTDVVDKSQDTWKCNPTGDGICLENSRALIPPWEFDSLHFRQHIIYELSSI